MLNLLVRLSKAKDGWIAERNSDPFPFDRAIASACQGRFEQYVDGKVQRSNDDLQRPTAQMGTH